MGKRILLWGLVGVALGNGALWLFFRARAPLYKTQLVVRSGRIDSALWPDAAVVVPSYLPPPFNDPPPTRGLPPSPRGDRWAEVWPSGEPMPQGARVNQVDSVARGGLLRISVVGTSPSAADQFARALVERTQKTFGRFLDHARALGSRQLQWLERSSPHQGGTAVPSALVQRALDRIQLEGALSSERSFNYEVVQFRSASATPFNRPGLRHWIVGELGLVCLLLYAAYWMNRRSRVLG